jgi:hypothetical protein
MAHPVLRVAATHEFGIATHSTMKPFVPRVETAVRGSGRTSVSGRKSASGAVCGDSARTDRRRTQSILWVEQAPDHRADLIKGAELRIAGTDVEIGSGKENGARAP